MLSVNSVIDTTRPNPPDQSDYPDFEWQIMRKRYLAGLQNGGRNASILLLTSSIFVFRPYSLFFIIPPLPFSLISFLLYSLSLCVLSLPSLSLSFLICLFISFDHSFYPFLPPSPPHFPPFIFPLTLPFIVFLPPTYLSFLPVLPHPKTRESRRLPQSHATRETKEKGGIRPSLGRE